MRKGTEKKSLRELIVRLEKAGKENNSPIWIRAAELLKLPTRKAVCVNAGKVAKVCKDGEVALIPGKLLGDGVIETKLNVAAYEWTPSAKKKIESAGGKVISIDELVKSNVKGTGVRLLR